MNRSFALALFALVATTAPLPAADPPRGDVRDALLLLDEGPLHLRFHVVLEGRPLSERRAEYIDGLMQQLDLDDDGSVSHQERAKSPLFSYGRRTMQNEFLDSLRKFGSVSKAEVESDLLRFGTLFSYREDDSPAEGDREVFVVLDNDGSRVIDQREIRTAVTRVAALDQDRDQCVSFDEFRPQPETPDDPRAVSITAEEDDGPPPVHLSRTLRGTENITLSRDLLARYDADRDRGLTADELGWNPERIEPVDGNRDGRLSLQEMAAIDRSPVDLELYVDLAWSGSEGTPLQVLHSATDRQIPAPRPDLVRMVFGEATVTFAFRQLDPVAAALETARRRFNLLDLDANGYLDRDEVEADVWFRRNLFDGMDRDGDDQVYAEELESFVVAVCEPAATTCHVNVYHAGQGFFQMLDGSGDGRISLRELRGLEQRLMSYEKRPGKGIAPEDLGRNYYVEFVRGSFQLFGRSQRLIDQGPSFIERGAIGPEWFQGMDRNRDGDLTYRVGNPLYPPEFLGPLETARQMDQDTDGLISFLEAQEFAARLDPETSESSTSTASSSTDGPANP